MADDATEHEAYSRHGADDAIVRNVPVPLRVGAAWSWRIVVIGVVLFALVNAFAALAPIVLPLIIALIIAAPMERAVTWMSRGWMPRALAALLSIFTLIIVVLGLAVAAGSSIVSGFDELRIAAINGFHQFVDWLADGPLNLGRERLDEIIANIQSTVQDNAWGVASGALTVTGTIGALFAGIVIALLALFFFLRDGRGMWLWFIHLLPGDNVDRVDRAGINAWTTLRRYAQTSVFVAFVDAVGIGLAAWILGVPLALPLGIIVFLFSFIPLFGATISGAIAVMVALFDGGWVTALLMLAAVLVVQQVEGNVLYPWLFGKVASIHPMAILLTVAAGTLLAGLLGAVIAVPIVAFGAAFARGLHKEFRPDDEEPPITGQIPVLAERSREAFRKAKERISHTSEIRVRRRAERTGEVPAIDADAAGDVTAEQPTGAEPRPGSVDSPSREIRQRPTKTGDE